VVLRAKAPKLGKKSLNTAIASGVDSITVYKMDLYANTPYYKSILREGLNLPTDEEELEFMQYALDRFKEEDYQPWSFFTFTKHGENKHKHSPSLWRGDDLYSFGSSAFGILGNWHFQNYNDTDVYIDSIEKGIVPISRGCKMNALEEMTRAIVLGMKLVSMDLDHFQHRFGFRLEKLCKTAIDELIAEGKVELTEKELRLTQAGILHGDYAGKYLSRALLANG
jgi:oxygen-independent coproporphyrinogen-3 oxidase